eukprot:1157822-Pelagomonas_calceolata.AAC.19
MSKQAYPHKLARVDCYVLSYGDCWHFNIPMKHDLPCFAACHVNLLGEALASLLVRGPFLNARSQTWPA